MFAAKVQAGFIKRLAVQILPWTCFYTFGVVLRGNSYHLTQSAEGVDDDFGVLDLVTTSYLCTLRDFRRLSFSAVVSSASLGKIPRKATRKTTIVDATINILGPEELAISVGEALTDASCYLQHPVFLEPGTRYANPHYFYPDDTMTDLRHFIGPKTDDSRSARVAQGIGNVLESLSNVPIPGSRECNIETEASNYLVNTRLKRLASSIRFLNCTIANSLSSVLATKYMAPGSS